MSTEPDASADPAAERARANSIEDSECRGVAATPEVLDQLRHQVAGWAGRAGMAMGRLQDLVPAVYEAMANVAVHAYAGEPGLLDLHAGHRGGRITVTVIDYGRRHAAWARAAVDPHAHRRGPVQHHAGRYEGRDGRGLLAWILRFPAARLCGR